MGGNPFTLSGKTILVTGASSGIGRKTAMVLDELDAKLVLVGRNKEVLEKTRSELKSNKHHLVAPFDLNNISDINTWLKGFVSQNEFLLDGVVHSAGLHKTVPLRLGDIQHYDELMRINLYAGIAILQSMMNKKVGKTGFSFIFISSVMGQVGQAGVSGYSSTKGAVDAFVKSSALEAVTRQARVNSIAPGFVESEMSEQIFSILTEEQQEVIIGQHPLGIGSPEDIAFGAAYLLSDAAKWITGTVLTIDGGYTCH